MKDTAPISIIGSFRYAFSSWPRLRTEVLAGLVIALALIPETISFSVLAGLDPATGLYTSVIMAIVISFTGGRPAMVTGAAGAVALVTAPVGREHGTEFIVATVLLAGVIQIILALLGVAKLMRFIPKSVMTGFVNALGILLFTSQLPHLIGVPWLVYPLVALGLAIMVFFPKLTSAVPAPLIVILVLTALVIMFDWNVPNVGAQGELPTTLPALMIPDVPFTWETLQIIFPYAIAVSIVGLMESLLTAELTDGITGTRSPKTRESWGQGVANIASGIFGGMGGCAMIGQTIIGVRTSGARTRLSTFLAGVFLLILVLVLGELTGLIPMAALVAVMIVVSFTTIEWSSLKPARLRAMPISETLAMLVTVVGTLATSNLAVGVILGAVTAMIAFASRSSRIAHVNRTEPGHYVISGPLFFASTNEMQYRFNYRAGKEHVVLDFSGARILDASAVTALDDIRRKYEENGTTVEYRGLNEESAAILERLSQA